MKTFATFMFFAAALPAFAIPQNPEEPPASIAAPDGKTSVRILQKAMPGTDGVTDFFTLEVLRGDDVILRAQTEGYLLTAYWSTDGSFMAVNNRRGNSGDYVWVFDLKSEKILKRPDDKTGEAWIDSGLGQIRKSLRLAGKEPPYRYWLTANGWEDDAKLRFTVRARCGEAGTFNAEALASWTGSAWKHTPVSVTKAE